MILIIFISTFFYETNTMQTSVRGEITGEVEQLWRELWLPGSNSPRAYKSGLSLWGRMYQFFDSNEIEIMKDQKT